MPMTSGRIASSATSAAPISVPTNMRPVVSMVTCTWMGISRPTIFIAAPGGKAGLGNMADWIQRHGYVAVLLEESRNGDWEPAVGNFLAAHDDVLKRVRVAEGRKVATGMSGAARACSVSLSSAVGHAARLDDLPLLAVAEPEPIRGPSPVELALRDVDPDDLTPREALEALYRLKGLA